MTEEEIKKAAREYATTRIEGKIPWDQFNQLKYDAFLEGAKLINDKTNER